jgi:hypothetical protein
MRLPSILFCGTLLMFPAFQPASVYGQSQTPAADPQPAVATAPATVSASVSASGPATGQAQAAALLNAKPVKVWTNDEIRTLHDGISVVGNHAPQKVSATSKATAQAKDPAWYRRQIAPLREEIDKLDPQIAKLQAYLSGENVGEQASMHPKMVPTPQEQLKQMEAKRQADEAKLDDLLERARHEGIEPGALR